MTQKIKRSDYLLLLPTLIPFLLLFLVPLIYSFQLVFSTPIYDGNGKEVYTDGVYDYFYIPEENRYAQTDMATETPTGEMLRPYDIKANADTYKQVKKWGLDNFKRFFSDSRYYCTIWNTFRLVIPMSACQFIVAFMLAYFLRHKCKGKYIYRVLIIFPLTLGSLILAAGMTNFFRSTGWFNMLLMGLGIIDKPIKILYTYWGSFIAGFITGVAFLFSSFLGICEGIDSNLEIAAQTLGANKFKTFCMAFLPMVIIINISAPESRLKISDAPGADMEASEHVGLRNARLDGDRIAQFYDALLCAAYRPLHRRGKTLVVREFAWSRESGDRILRVIDSLPEDVIMGVKITSSDYWPTFPMNPNCHRLKGRRKWIEMDVWGENFAWSVLPVYRMGDYREKLLQAVEGADGTVDGIWCRVNWEAVTCVTAPETANDINCYGMAQVGKDLKREPADIIRSFLQDRYGWKANERQATLFRTFWETTYRYICKTPYVLGHVFTRHSLLPESYEQETWAIYGATRRGMWVDGADQSIVYSAHNLARSKENLKAVYQEKQEARVLCSEVLERADDVMKEADCPEKLRSQLSRGLEGIRLYTDAFCDAACGYFSVRYCREAAWDAEIASQAKVCIEGLRRTAQRQPTYLDEHPDYPHYIHFFYDEKRALSLADSLERNLREAWEHVH